MFKQSFLAIAIVSVGLSNGCYASHSHHGKREETKNKKKVSLVPVNEFQGGITKKGYLTCAKLPAHRFAIAGLISEGGKHCLDIQRPNYQKKYGYQADVSFDKIITSLYGKYMVASSNDMKVNVLVELVPGDSWNVSYFNLEKTPESMAVSQKGSVALAYSDHVRILESKDLNKEINNAAGKAINYSSIFEGKDINAKPAIVKFSGDGLSIGLLFVNHVDSNKALWHGAFIKKLDDSSKCDHRWVKASKGDTPHFFELDQSGDRCAIGQSNEISFLKNRNTGLLSISLQAAVGCAFSPQGSFFAATGNSDKLLVIDTDIRQIVFNSTPFLTKNIKSPVFNENGLLSFNSEEAPVYNLKY